MAAKRRSNSVNGTSMSTPQTSLAASIDPDAVAALLTVQDWWRYGTSAFTSAGLVFGHGTDNASDEAAFLILSILRLPVDALEPWLACRLTPTERTAIANAFNRRIEARLPASYITNTAWIQGRCFYVDERVIVPRSFIGELICSGRLDDVVAELPARARILELCTGSGCLAILAAEAHPDVDIVASDLSAAALEVAKRNIADYRLADQITLVQSDLFNSVPTGPYDMIIANPPYVTEDAVDAFPPEYRAEPRMAHIGGYDGLDLVHRILLDAPKFLAPGGAIVVEIGQGRDALEAVRPDLPFLWLDTVTSEGEVFVLQASDFENANTD
jgi:ribosomal protein L3 glutamine methyltransferase